MRYFSFTDTKSVTKIMKNVKITNTAHQEVKPLAAEVGCSMGRLIEAMIKKQVKDVRSGRVKASPNEFSDVEIITL